MVSIKNIFLIFPSPKKTMSDETTATQHWKHCEKCHGAVPGSTEVPSTDEGKKIAGDSKQLAATAAAAAAAPASIDLDWPSIVFGGGVPVGGYAHLTIRSDGSYTFSGHFHDSGLPSYNVALAWAVKDSRNVVYQFAAQGSVSGTFGSGSSDFNWNVNRFDERLVDNWASLAAGWNARASATANFSLGALWDSIVSALGTVLEVVSIIAVG